MSRLFDGVNDRMIYPVTGATYGTSLNNSYGTSLIVARILQSDGSWMSLLERLNASSSLHNAFGRHSNSGLYSANGVSTAENFALQATSADNWAIYACTKVTGSVAPILIKHPIGGSVSSVTAGVALANYSDSGTGTVSIGGPSDWANMRVAAAAVFAGIVLTNANIQTIAAAATTQSILDLGATWAVDDSDGFATDLVGSQDRTSDTGTVDDGDDPSGWVYFGEGPTPSQRFMWMP